MPPGIEIFRNEAAQEIVVRNHSLDAILYVVPGQTRRMDTTVSLEPGKLLYIWLDKSFTFATKWRIFPLLRGPD